MQIDELERANELIDIIRVTSRALENLMLMKEKIRGEKENRVYDDRLYSLNISEHSDGSGKSASLNRYHGNAELLDVIIECVSKQLVEMKEEFKGI